MKIISITLLLNITSFDIIDGSSSASGVIKAGETKEFNFAIIPGKISAYNLPSSIVKFTNIFAYSAFITSTLIKHNRRIVLRNIYSFIIHTTNVLIILYKPLYH